MKTPVRIADFRERVTLCRLTSTVDSELNRSYSAEELKTVWAVVQVKNSTFDNTAAGFRPEVTYDIVIRAQSIECDCLKWQGKLLRLTKPWYALDTKYIAIEAVEFV